MAEKIKGAKILLEALKKEGVDTIFGYPGGVLLEIYDELYKQDDIKHYLPRHEQGAAHAADGYARATGKVGVCLGTSGPGATNLVTGIATAHMDSIPMVALTGQVTTGAIGKDSFQEADITGITLPITKHNYLVKDVKDIAKTVKEAFYIARSGRPGPVLIDLPKDITVNRAVFEDLGKVDIPSYKPTFKGNPKQIKAAAELIAKSEKPLIITGGGVVLSEASKELTALATKTNIPVASTLLGIGTFPEDHKQALGMVGMHGSVYANYSVAESDLIIAVGMRFSDRVTGKLSTFIPHAKIIHIDIDPAEISKCVPATIPIVGDVKEVLKELNPLLKAPKIDEWWKQIQVWKTDYPLAYLKKTDKVYPQFVLEEVERITQGKAIMATDVGEHQMWAAQYLKTRKPRHFLTSGGLGTMGYGLPAALGAQVGHPGKLVMVVSGDGSLQMNIQELGTLARYDLPVKIILLNNGYLGMVRQWQDLFYEKRYSETDLAAGGNPDFVKVAEAYGILGLRANNPEEVGKIIEQALAHKGPVLMDFVVEPEANVYPMMPSGGVINKLIMEEEAKGENYS